MGLSIFYCDVCGVRVTDVDLRSGHGMRRRWDVICATCLELGHGRDWLAARPGFQPVTESTPTVHGDEHTEAAPHLVETGMVIGGTAPAVRGPAQETPITVADPRSATMPPLPDPPVDVHPADGGTWSSLAPTISHNWQGQAQAPAANLDGPTQAMSRHGIPSITPAPMLADPEGEGTATVPVTAMVPAQPPTAHMPTGPVEGSPSLGPSAGFAGAAAGFAAMQPSAGNGRRPITEDPTVPSSPQRSNAVPPPRPGKPPSAPDGKDGTGRVGSSGSRGSRPGSGSRSGGKGSGARSVGGLPLPVRVSLITLPIGLLLLGALYVRQQLHAGQPPAPPATGPSVPVPSPGATATPSATPAPTPMPAPAPAVLAGSSSAPADPAAAADPYREAKARLQTALRSTRSSVEQALTSRDPAAIRGALDRLRGCEDEISVFTRAVTNPAPTMWRDEDLDKYLDQHQVPDLRAQGSSLRELLAISETVKAAQGRPATTAANVVGAAATTAKDLAALLPGSATKAPTGKTAK